jgi:hypothetical protein
MMAPPVALDPPPDGVVLQAPITATAISEPMQLRARAGIPDMPG